MQSEMDEEIARLCALPWSRELVADHEGVYTARVPELANCEAAGATPKQALDRLNYAIAICLRQALAEGGPVPQPRLNGAPAKRYPQPPKTRAARLGFSPRKRLPAIIRRGLDAVDRLAFPEDASPANHWQRIVLNETVDTYITSLHPASLTAAEISGDTHADKPWRSYTTLNYPEFDLCAPLRDDRRFDVVICEQVLEHVNDPNAAARNLRALCVPGGHVIVSTPFLVRVHELSSLAMDDYWRFTPKGLRTLLEQAGLEMETVGAWGNRLCVAANLTRWSGYRRWHPLGNEANVPLQVWAFARNPVTSTA